MSDEIGYGNSRPRRRKSDVSVVGAVASFLSDGSAVASFITTVGVPSAISIFLVWWMTQTMEKSITVLSQTMSAISASSVALTSEMDDRQAEHYEMLFYLRGICLNTAMEPEDRQNCFMQPPR